MGLNWKLLILTVVSMFAFNANAQTEGISISESTVEASEVEGSNILDELDPFDPNIEEKLNQLDVIYEEETGDPANISNSIENMMYNIMRQQTCYRNECEIWAQVVKSTQTLYLYIQGRHEYTWKVSTGLGGRGTPNLDLHPNGRIYDRYTSSKFPGGDFKGLGNMPYAVFLTGGFAIHGTAEVNWKKLGQRASHGCIRIHPDNAYIFNRHVRRVGTQNVWVTVQD